MKISLWIPKEKDIFNVRSFLQDEIHQAENIKSKETRNSVKKSLGKMIEKAVPGHCIYTESEYAERKPYNGNSFFYRCGRQFFQPEKQNTFT